MKIKNFAAFAAALVVLVLGVWACSKNQDFNPKTFDKNCQTAFETQQTASETFETYAVVLRHSDFGHNCPCPNCKCSFCPCPLGICFCGGKGKPKKKKTSFSFEAFAAEAGVDVTDIGLVDISRNGDSLEFIFKQATAVNGQLPFSSDWILEVAEKISFGLDTNLNYKIPNGLYAVDATVGNYGKATLPIKY